MKKQLLCLVLMLLGSCWADEFRIDQNTLKVVNDKTGLVLESMHLKYFFSDESGGYVSKTYEGKVCSAWHPDQFYENCYNKYKNEKYEMFWHLREKQNTTGDNKYDVKVVNHCLKRENGLCSYRDIENNFEPIFLSHVMIIDEQLLEDTEGVIGIIKEFESPADILILVANDAQSMILDMFSINASPNVTLTLHHQIDFNCEFLDGESTVTKILCMLYLVVSILWIYRNKYHYPNTMTVLHRLLTVPPVVKFLLMIANYYMFYLCPWNSINLKVYVILVKILLNLVYESMLVGVFFLVAMGYKIAKSNINNNEFGIMLGGMLLNYISIFILMVFNEFYHIGTILYTAINILFIFYLVKTGGDILKRLIHILEIAQNQRYPEQAIRVKISLMSKSMAIISLFFTLEIIYHGVFRLFGYPNTRESERLFYMVHETTDFLLISFFLFTLKTGPYIPYYGVVNLDNNDIENNGNVVEMQPRNESVTLQYIVDRKQYINNMSAEGVQYMNLDDLAIIVNPDDHLYGQPDEIRAMTTIDRQMAEYHRLKVGVLVVNNGKNEDTDEITPLFYKESYPTQLFLDKEFSRDSSD